MTVQSIAMQQALEQLRAMREQVRSHAAAPDPSGVGQVAPTSGIGRGAAIPMLPPKVEGPSFMETMKAAIDGVNEQQQLARAMQNAYVRGEDVSITDVAIAMQKSSVAFEATVQVRNKVLESYREIMSMSV